MQMRGSNQGTIWPLIDPETGNPYPGFPKTRGELKGMSSTELDRVLKALGFPLSEHADTALKRYQLAGAIGCLDFAKNTLHDMSIFL
jgi:hypothetical protein